MISIDISTPSGYDTSVSPKPFGGSVVSFSNGNDNRSIDIKGAHYIATNSYRTRRGEQRTATLWDHTLSSQVPLQVGVHGTARSVSGTVVVQHNRALCTARSQLSDVRFDYTQCGCHPISGSVITQLSGSRNGTESLTFTGCGVADYRGVDGAVKSISLYHCL